MKSLSVLLVSWIITMIFCELVLKGSKLQTGLPKVLLVYCLIGGGLVAYSFAFGFVSPIAVMVFWSGCFLSWFGIRSHLESSILLRMLFLLRKHPWTERELLAEYDSHYGASTRLEELVRGGLTQAGSNPPVLTSKGQTIVKVVRSLNRN